MRSLDCLAFAVLAAILLVAPISSLAQRSNDTATLASEATPATFGYGRYYFSPRCETPWDSTVGVLKGSRPLLIGHRGSPGTLPEHTLESYQLAIDQGADCIECDVVVTKDLQLICRHEPWLQNTTDACAKYPDRFKTYNLPEAGGNVTGIFSIDLTLAEVKKLRAAQAFPWRNQGYNYQYGVPTFKEYVALARSANRTVCIYPETKHPTFFQNHSVLKAASVTVDDLLMREMALLGYNLRAPIGSTDWLRSPAFIQSFEQNNLRYWRSKTALPLVQLVDAVPAADTNNTAEYLTSEAGIREISQYAWGYAPWKGLYVVQTDRNIVKVDPAPIRLAAKYGMPTTVWTLRNEPSYLAIQFNGNSFNEYNLMFNILGVMGGFSDHPYSVATWVRQSYRRADSSVADRVAANPAQNSLYATAGEPSWYYAPVCQIYPIPSTNPLKFDFAGNNYLVDNDTKCAYKHIVQYPIQLCNTP